MQLIRRHRNSADFSIRVIFPNSKSCNILFGTMDKYANKLIENLPMRFTPQRIDLVLGGGLFNGSYLAGAMYFLKEMERRNYIRVERISGCSVGSLVGLLYCIDSLDIMETIYNTLYLGVQITRDFSILKNIREILDKRINEESLQKVNRKLYITYHNIEKRTKPVRREYTSVDDLVDTVIRSCFIPGAIDGNLLYKEKYMDGMFPYMFSPKQDKRILYLDLHGYDKIYNIACAKNERTNCHRILSGLLDIHTFYIKQSNTSMCSYVDNWGIYHRAFDFCRHLIIAIIVRIIYLIAYIRKRLPESISNNVICKIAHAVSFEIYRIFVETYIV
jgi:hypothetical protein